MNNRIFDSKKFISRTKAGLLSSLMAFSAGNICVNSKVLENRSYQTQNKDYIINKHDKKIALPVSVIVLALAFGAWYFSGGSPEENREKPQENKPIINPNGNPHKTPTPGTTEPHIEEPIVDPNKTPTPGTIEPHTEEPIVEPIVEEEEDNPKYREYKQALDAWKVDRAEYLEAATNFDEDSKPILYVLATCLDLFFCRNAHFDGNNDVWKNYKKIDFEFAKNAFAGAVININENYADKVLEIISNLSVDTDDWNGFVKDLNDVFSPMKLRWRYYKISDFIAEKVDYEKEMAYNDLFELIVPRQLDIEQQKQVLLYISADILKNKYWEKYGSNINLERVKFGSINALYDLGFCESKLDSEKIEDCKKVFYELKSKHKKNKILDCLEFIYKVSISEINVDLNRTEVEKENNRRFWRELPILSEGLIKNELRKMSIDQSEIDDRLIKIVSENVLSKDSPKSKIEAGFKGVK